MAITTFSEAQTALRPFYDYSRTPYTLDAMQALLEYLGNPQESLKIVHIAGTSGKTSTAYYTAALLRETGASVGLSVSPHVDQVNERLQINGAPLPQAEFCAVLDEFLTLITKAPVQPSYFELLAAMAFWEFARRRLDYAVMEVGLGGLLDATNVVSRPDKVCVITDIGLDHTEILGDTLAAIAAQKAGIIHDGNQVFMYEQSAEVMEVVQAKAHEHHATLHALPPTAQIERSDLPLFQQRNLGLALAAVTFVLNRDGRPVPDEAAQTRAAQVVVPARLERRRIGDKTVIMDGAHNAQKMQALVESLQALYPGQQFTVLAAFVDGNPDRWQGAVKMLLPVADTIVFTSFHGEQDLPKSSADPAMIAAYCVSQYQSQCSVVADPATALRQLLAASGSVVLVTGSFYLLNHIRPLLAEAAA